MGILRNGYGVSIELTPGTSGLAIFSVEREGRIIYLIDTPGFDDTNRSDIETLRSISHYLSISYANRVSISGILYLHRVSDVRLHFKMAEHLSRSTFSNI